MLPLDNDLIYIYNVHFILFRHPLFNLDQLFICSVFKSTGSVIRRAKEVQKTVTVPSAIKVVDEAFIEYIHTKATFFNTVFFFLADWI